MKKNENTNQLIRTISMIKSCVGQRSVIGFLLILISILLLTAVFCFFPSFNNNFENDGFKIYTGEKEINNKNNKNIFKKNDKPNLKISLKKQIFISLFISKNSIHLVSNLIRSWVSDFVKHPNSGGFHFLSEIPIPVQSYNNLIINNNNIKTEEDKFFLKLYFSILNYSQNSRSLWYLYLNENSFINLETFNNFSNILINKLDPSKNEIIEINQKDNKIYSILISRYSIKNILEFKENITLIKNYFKNKNLNFNNNYSIIGQFNLNTIEILSKSNFELLEKCLNNFQIFKLKDIFLWILPILEDPLLLIKLKLFKESNDLIYFYFNNNLINLCIL